MGSLWSKSIFEPDFDKKLEELSRKWSEEDKKTAHRDSVQPKKNTPRPTDLPKQNTDDSKKIITPN